MTWSPPTRRIVERALVGIALAVYVVAAVTAARHKANAFDELPHLTAGYAYWTFDDYRLQPENGNWPQRLGALPAVLHGANFVDTDSNEWRGSDVWTLGDRFFFSRGNDIDTFLFEGRCLIALLGAALGLLVFVWARRTVGALGGAVALLLFVASPTMLAHGALVTSDMAAALGFLAATGALWRVMHRVTIWTVLQSALAVAALLLSKMSGLLIAPIAFVLVLLRLFLGRPLIWRRSRKHRWNIVRPASRQFAVIAALGVAHLAVAFVLIWASFGFRYTAFTGSAPDQHFLVEWSQVLGDGAQRNTPAARVVAWARDARVLPEAYLYGLSHTLTFAATRRSFLNGEVSLTGHAAFFPYAFAVKSTLPFMALCLLGVVAWIRFRAPGRRLYRLLPLVILLLVYGGAALATHLNIGQRHLLPMYPALFVLASASVWLGNGAKQGGTRPRVMAGVVAALCVWHVGESASVRPDYLAYFNEIVGGPSQGYRHLVDSSLDWGQDLPALKQWLDTHRYDPAEPVYLSYFGSSRPSHFGIEATLLPGMLDRRSARGEPWRPGIYAISATMLSGVYLQTGGRWTADTEAEYERLKLTIQELVTQPERRAAVTRETGTDPLPGVVDAYDNFRMGRLAAYLQRRAPLAEVGYSILIFRMTDADLKQALEDPL